MILKLTLIITFLSSLMAFAAPPNPLAVDFIEAKGRGCPPGSFSYAMTPDGSVLSVLFSQFTAQANSEIDIRQQSACNLILRIRMAKGYGVGIVNADYSGFVSLIGPNSRAVFRSGWVLRDNGQKVATGPNLNQIFSTPVNSNFYVRTPTPDIQWIGCNDQQARLILQSSIAAVARKGSEAMITVDSSDISTQMKFFLSVRPCP